MSIKTNAISVGTTPTKLYVGGSSGAEPTLTVPMVVRNNDASVAMYVGGADVTTASGFPVKAQEYTSFDVAAGDIMYGIVASGTVEARVMIGRQR